MCSAVPPALSCPPASWVWRAAARIRGGGGGVAGREGRGRGGKGGREDGAERRGGAAAATGSPDCVSSPTRMSSSGEEDQAVHGSSAPPAAAAQTVAVPHTGLGNCRLLRGAQCACAAPAVAVPPVLMLRLLLRLRPRWRSPGRGLSMSRPAPRPGAGEREEPTPAPLCQSLGGRPRPLLCALLSAGGPGPPRSRSWINAAPPSPTSARLRASGPLLCPWRSGQKLAVRGPRRGRGRGRSRQEPERARGGRRDHIAAPPAGVSSPKRAGRVGGAPPRLSAEQALTGRRDAGQPPDAVHPRPLWGSGSRSSARSFQRPPYPAAERSQQDLHANGPRAPGWSGAGSCRPPAAPHPGASQGCGALERVASPATAAKLLKRLHLTPGVGEEGG